MIRSSFQADNCSVAQTLEVVGDSWTMMIIREAFLGTRRFGEFEKALNISKNVLTQRLAHLVQHEVLEKTGAHRGAHLEYRLTARGRDLLTLITTLRQWGDRWIMGEGAEPVLVLDRRTGRSIETVRVLGADGRPIDGRHIELRPGPGATEETHERFRTFAARASRNAQD